MFTIEVFRAQAASLLTQRGHLTSEIVPQWFFQDFFTGFLPSFTLSNKATSGLPLFRKSSHWVKVFIV
jgi:hypothetical protein